MTKRFSFFLRVLFCITAVCAPRQPAGEEAAADSARTWLMLQRYEPAESLMRRQSARMPGNLEALYMRCTIWQTRILDYESYTADGDAYLHFADSAVGVLVKAMDSQRGSDSVRALFYMGSILGGKGIVFAKKGNWPLAVRYALRSVGYFKQVVALDSAYYAAYYGIGVFNYYLSQNLKWLPFFGDKRAEALRQIKLSTRAPVPFNFAAGNSLCWILIERNEFNAADSLVSEVLSRYPDNTLFIRIKVRAEIGLRLWARAELHARRLIYLSERKQPKNWADMVSGYQALVCCYDNLHQDRQCAAAAAAALRLEVPEAFRKIPFVKRHFSYITEISKKHDTIK